MHLIALETTYATILKHVGDQKQAIEVQKALVSLQLCGFSGLPQETWQRYNFYVYRVLPPAIIMAFLEEWRSLFPKYQPGLVDQKVNESSLYFEGSRVYLVSALLPWMS